MNNAQFTRETFWNILSGGKGIVIPIIQRAYTQGGRGNDPDIEEKGSAFLKYLVDALCSANNEKIELDFVYGTVEDNKLLPLDGQQRLTTLFLLHWYIAQKENRLTDDVKIKLKKFSYETRPSSRYFCRKLCDFQALTDNNIPLSQVIENEHWFVLSWKNDPSVLSMLGMIDKIQKNLSGFNEPLWNKIILPPEEAPITFFYTPLEAFNLTDELYIKMNARGKELTPFEKFKASIEKKIDFEKWDDDKPLNDKFGVKIDNEWTNLFWQFRSKNKAIDRYMLRFFAAGLVNHYAGDDENKARWSYDNPEIAAPENIDKDSYSYLYETVNLFVNAREAFKDDLTINTADFWWGDKRAELKTFGDFFSLFIAYKDVNLMTWQQRILFYAFTVYLKNNSRFDAEKLSDWLRFTRNIITNVPIDSYAPFVSAKNRITEFAKASSDIYSHLVSAKSAGGFALEQIKEEIQKAKIYKASPNAAAIIRKMENCNFCRGRIGFLLNCLDINDVVLDISHLEKMCGVIYEHLNDDNISDDFRRAMFVCDENFYYYRGYSWYLGETKYSLIDDRNDLVAKYAYSNDLRTECLKKLLLLLCQFDIESIIKAYDIANTPGWKKRLITEPELLKKCLKHIITIPDENDHCHILYGQRPSYSEYWGASYEEVR